MKLIKYYFYFELIELNNSYKRKSFIILFNEIIEMAKCNCVLLDFFCNLISFHL